MKYQIVIKIDDKLYTDKYEIIFHNLIAELEKQMPKGNSQIKVVNNTKFFTFNQINVK